MAERRPCTGTRTGTEQAQHGHARAPAPVPIKVKDSHAIALAGAIGFPAPGNAPASSCYFHPVCGWHAVQFLRLKHSGFNFELTAPKLGNTMKLKKGQFKLKKGRFPKAGLILNWPGGDSTKDRNADQTFSHSLVRFSHVMP